MVLPYGAPPFVVDLEGECSAGLQDALLDGAEVHDEVACPLLGVRNAEAQPISRQPAGIADLTSRLGIERRLVEHHRTALAFAERRNLLAVAREGDDSTGGVLGLVAEEISA